MVKSLARAFVIVALALGGASCGSDDDGAPADAAPSTTSTTEAEGNVLTVTETEYAYAVEGSPRPGALTIQVSNEGKELHMIAMAKLQPGKTVDDAKKILAEADPNAQENPLDAITERDDDAPIDDLGGLQFPGTSYAISGDGVTAGEYLLLCFIPTPDGKPHFAEGMVSGFTVAGEDFGATLPEAKVTYTADDEKLSGPETLDAGRTTLLLKNGSKVNREVNLVKLKPGKTPADIDAYTKSIGEEDIPDVAAAPTEFFGFVFDADGDRTITVDLTPGTWLLNMPDPEQESDKPAAEDPYVVQIVVT